MKQTVDIDQQHKLMWAQIHLRDDEYEVLRTIGDLMEWIADNIHKRKIRSPRVLLNVIEEQLRVNGIFDKKKKFIDCLVELVLKIKGGIR